MTPETFTFTMGHHCFPEALQFFAHYVGRAALAGFPSERDSISICDSRLEFVRLHAVTEVRRLLTREGPEPSSLSFSMEIEPIRFPNEPQNTYQTLPGERLGPSLCTYLLGYAYERHSKELQDKLGKSPLNWPQGLQFFRHVRNACFHGGTFKIWPHQIARNPPPNMGQPAPNIPEWRGHEIRFHRSKDIIVDEHDIELNGRCVINDYIGVSEVLILLHDMGTQIAQILGR